MSLVTLLQKKRNALRTNEEGTLVRTTEGHIWREKMVEGQVIKELVDQQQFVPIEAAPDPQVCRIIDHLYLGSQDAALNRKELDSNNVKFILNVSTGITNAYPEHYAYCTIPILDVEEASIVEQFPKCFHFIEEAIRNGAGILVHCNAGVSRSASVVIGYLMYKQKLSLEEAFQLTKTQRPKIQPNAGFMEQLKAYQKTLGIE